MRPRFMNRGSLAQLFSQALGFVASMRPRFMNRGSEAQALGESFSTSGFNEAPIHESGKCHARTYAVAEVLGFNEAPIHESGKSRKRPVSRR